MENYIALLLLVMPGFIARKIYKQTNNVKEDLNTFEETLYCLLNSTIIIMAMCGIVVIASRFNPAVMDLLWFSTLKQYFDDIKFMIGYGVAALLMACILGLLTHKLLSKYNEAINYVRKKKSMGNLVISHTIFDDVFNSDGMRIVTPKGSILPRFVEVYKDGKFLGRGGLQMTEERSREFYLENCEIGIKKLFDRFGELPPIKGVYIDGRNGITIREYDLSALFQFEH